MAFDEIVEAGKGFKEYVGCNNYSLICKDAFSKLVKWIQKEKQEFAILSAFGFNQSWKENIEQISQLRQDLSKHG